MDHVPENSGEAQARVAFASHAAETDRTGLLPELLAPAGDWECVRAAVENGADAIYFGLEKFNARMRAHNFTEADLPRLMQFLHNRGVKGYVTFNTLVFENEMTQAEQYAGAIIAAGVDAAIVQDVGVCRMIRALSPDFPIHASTQMTITSAAGVDFARELGCNLVVLARECSLKEIEKLSVAPSEVEPSTGMKTRLPLEVFVHGALCVAYSGQCLTSEALGGRSANRGECAQACRMPYELIADGTQVDLGMRKYLLSPQDLAGLDVLPELVRLGISSLKIEGRLKAPEYVANITRVYRDALDRLAVGTDPGRNNPLKPRVRYEMEMAFSRGLYTGWFQGINNQRLVHGCFGKKRGVYLGKVLEVRRNAVKVGLEQELAPGDGVVFDAGRPEEQEEGGRVYEIVGDKMTSGSGAGGRENLGDRRDAWLRFGQDDVDFNRVQAGDKLWKTSDPRLEKELRQTYEVDRPRFRRPLQLEVHGAVGLALTVIARDEMGHVVRCQSAMPLAQAQTKPFTTERLQEQLGRLGGTPFRLASLQNHLSGDVLLPVSELNRIRRQVVEELERLRARPSRWKLRNVLVPRPLSAPYCPPERQSSRLIVLARTEAQLEVALEEGISTVYCEFEDPKRYRHAVARFRERTKSCAQATIFVAPPRIYKMGEEWTLRQVRESEADGYLVRNYDHLRFFKNDRRVGDYSLNIANRFTADYFRNNFGLERLTASYDLNFEQLETLLQAAPADWFEVTLHQHIPMFHMEHCVFCAFLSNGTDFTNCGRPCDTREVQLRDRVGAEHPVKADAGCRNTVFNARAQSGAEFAGRMLELGVRDFRIEFLNETPDTVRQTIHKYQELLSGDITGAQVWRDLKLINQLGVTRGQLAGKKSQ